MGSRPNALAFLRKAIDLTEPSASASNLTNQFPAPAKDIGAAPRSKLEDFAEAIVKNVFGHNSVVLVGDSAGGPAVRRFMAERIDKRVVG